MISPACNFLSPKCTPTPPNGYPSQAEYGRCLFASGKCCWPLFSRQKQWVFVPLYCMKYQGIFCWLKVSARIHHHMFFPNDHPGIWHLKHWYISIRAVLYLMEPKAIVYIPQLHPFLVYKKQDIFICPFNLSAKTVISFDRRN